MNFTPEQIEAAKTALHEFRQFLTEAETQGRAVLKLRRELGRKAFEGQIKQVWSAERRIQSQRLMKLAKAPTDWNSAASIIKSLELAGAINSDGDRAFAKGVLFVSGIK